MDKNKLLVELVKVMDEYEYRLYSRDWIFALVGVAWDRVEEDESDG